MFQGSISGFDVHSFPRFPNQVTQFQPKDTQVITNLGFAYKDPPNPYIFSSSDPQDSWIHWENTHQITDLKRKSVKETHPKVTKLPWFLIHKSRSLMKLKTPFGSIKTMVFNSLKT